MGTATGMATAITKTKVPANPRRGGGGCFPKANHPSSL
jgi:hypothetical protein